MRPPAPCPRSGDSGEVEGEFVSVSTWGGHTCGIRRDGSVACCGSNGSGEASPAGGSFPSVSAGVRHTWWVRPDGSVECWGSGVDGRATSPEGEFASGVKSAVIRAIAEGTVF